MNDSEIRRGYADILEHIDIKNVELWGLLKVDKCLGLGNLSQVIEKDKREDCLWFNRHLCMLFTHG